jgi:hypothetical protein
VPDLDLTDADGDGAGDVCDSCPATPNPDQADADADGTGDACQEECGDSDADGLTSGCDNCPETPNDDQLDFDEDGAGDACDPADLAAAVRAASSGAKRERTAAGRLAKAVSRLRARLVLGRDARRTLKNIARAMKTLARMQAHGLAPSFGATIGVPLVREAVYFVATALARAEENIAEGAPGTKGVLKGEELFEVATASLESFDAAGAAEAAARAYAAIRRALRQGPLSEPPQAPIGQPAGGPRPGCPCR